MIFTLKRDEDNTPWLESSCRIYRVIFSNVTFEYELIFSNTYDGVVGDRRLDLLVDKMEKFLMEPIDISKKDFQSMKNFFESYGAISNYKNRILESNSPDEIKNFARLEIMNGTSIEVDMTSKTALMIDASGRKTKIRGRELDAYIDMFSDSEASEDQDLDFSEYLIYKIMSKKN